MNPLLLGGLILFGLFLLFYAVWSAFLIYHLLRFALRREVALIQVAVFAAVSLFGLALTVAALFRVDWGGPLFPPRLGF